MAQDQSELKDRYDKPIILQEAMTLIHEAFYSEENKYLFKRPDLHVVVAKPWIQQSTHIESLHYFETRVIWFEMTFGDPRTWQYDYRKIARAKARTTWWHSLSMREIILTRPELLRVGDTVWPGSLIINGIVGASSGQKPAIDELMTELPLNYINFVANGVSLPDFGQRREFYYQLSLTDDVNAERLLSREDNCFIS